MILYITSAPKNGSVNLQTDNLLPLRLGHILDPIRSLMFKVVLFANSTPAVDFVFVEYYDLTNVILLMGVTEQMIIPNEFWSNALWLLWGIGTVVMLYYVWDRRLRDSAREKKANNRSGYCICYE